MEVIAVHTISNSWSLCIYEIEQGFDDYVIVGFNTEKPKKYKLYHNTKGSYFSIKGTRYYLDQFMRVR